MADKTPSFGSAEEEVKYWREQALMFQKGMLEAREELEEFQENSRDLEQELEAQLEQADTRFRELQIVSSRWQNENDAYKSRLEQLQQQYHHQLTEMEDELVQRRGSNDEYVTYIRELEQRNDEFERSTRIMHATIEDLETKLNSAIERNAFIESELDEKESLKTAVQRLKDESRDLRQELKVRERRELPDVENKKNIDLTKSHDRLIRFDADSSVSGSPLKLSTQHNAGAASPALTPSSRISALNIVGDLLRNVSTLENKVVIARSGPRREPNSETPRTRIRSTRTSATSSPATKISNAVNNNNNSPTRSNKSPSGLIRA